ncbi:hypothetical protein AaE_007579, partial [Aphanomyces astaci]
MEMLARIEGALLGLYVGDAVAMPVHWMVAIPSYNLQQLEADYGQITGYTKPKDTFMGSIMNLSSTGGGGRGSDKGDVVGSVILHGKKQFWVRGGNFHYHLGLQAGGGKHAGGAIGEAARAHAVDTFVRRNDGPGRSVPGS